MEAGTRSGAGEFGFLYMASGIFSRLLTGLRHEDRCRVPKRMNDHRPQQIPSAQVKVRVQRAACKERRERVEGAEPVDETEGARRQGHSLPDAETSADERRDSKAAVDELFTESRADGHWHEKEILGKPSREERECARTSRSVASQFTHGDDDNADHHDLAGEYEGPLARYSQAKLSQAGTGTAEQQHDGRGAEPVKRQNRSEKLKKGCTVPSAEQANRPGSEAVEQVEERKPDQHEADLPNRQSKRSLAGVF